MTVLRQIFGFASACFVGVLLPVAAEVYDGVYRHSHGSPAPWPSSLFPKVQFVALGSALVGLLVGVIGVGLLHWAHRVRLKDYVIAGLVLGAGSGASFTAISRIPTDPAVSWVVFIVLPSLSMAIGFTCYWCICIRGAANKLTGANAGETPELS